MKNPWTRKMDRKGRRPLQTKIEFTSWIVLGTAILVSSLFASWNFTLGVLAGGLISILNFYGLRRGLKGTLERREAGSAGSASLVFKYLLRLAITGLILYILLARTTIDIFGLVAGLATIVISIVFSVLMTVIDKSYLEEV